MSTGVGLGYRYCTSRHSCQCYWRSCAFWLVCFFLGNIVMVTHRCFAWLVCVLEGSGAPIALRRCPVLGYAL